MPNKPRTVESSRGLARPLSRRLRDGVSFSNLPLQERRLAPGPAYHGSHHTWFRKSSWDQVSHATMSPSIAAPIDRDDGISSTPGDSRCATNSLKWTYIVRRSPVTKTRPESAAMCRTCGSGVPSGITPAAPWKSMDGSLRRNPPSDVRIKISVSLKSDLQTGLADLSFFTRSNRSIISAGIGCWALISSKIRS